jgi:hypothetical protein
MHGWKLYVLLTLIIMTTISTGVSLLTAHNQVDRIDERLRAGRVCTQMNQGACQALFERLANNITDAQRRDLACVVFRTAGVKPNIDCPEG